MKVKQHDFDQEKFLNGKVKLFTCPDSVAVREYMKNGHCSCHEDLKEAYEDTVGYQFSWGHIIEGRPDFDTPHEEAFIEWDFCFPNTLAIYLEVGQHLEDLCNDFRSVMQNMDFPSTITLTDGWTSVSVFGLLTHIDHVKAARRWISNTFMRKRLPNLILAAESVISSGVYLLSK